MNTEMDMEFVIQLIKHGRLICKQLEEIGLISMSVKRLGSVPSSK